MTTSIPWSDVKTLNVDFDHTITDRTTDEYLPPCEQEPNTDLIEKLHDAYYDGKTIIVWTARPWSDASQVAGMLTLWDVPFHGLMMAKGGSDCYVDDKAMRPYEFVDQPSERDEDQCRLDEL
ncbi:capsular biosynthesis protein [Natronolimnohabitans sp. A-GB9]|uniref:capsular biosynthesis protein n=1 Tax=Natronolimnohabitans sp. A-GB9 TaxID=3069757 RepID=UPI0027B1F83A|nr:capsular biosynthesis protein [Natronolimnohabitans sp. A-GB9]MDQ2052895.1 capsular biosynthesis protein [Natronolimnohabitans sp. A-GB9]